MVCVDNYFYDKSVNIMKYISLTFGPITRIIESAENTRGLWAASYLFSYLAKKIIFHFKARKFLLPAIEDEMFTNNYLGAGIFPDRYIFESEDNDFDLLQQKVDEELKCLAKNMAAVVNRDNSNLSQLSCFDKITTDELYAFLKQYLKVYFCEKNYEDSDSEKMMKEEFEKKVKKESEKLLSLLEQQESLVDQISDSKAYLERFFYNIPNSFLTKDAGIGDKFPSIVEVSSGGCENEQNLLPYERYIAIVKADGDSLGKALEAMADANILSKALLSFNKDASTTISKFGGLPVYIGGDDLLFFAPVKNDGKSVFQLIDELDGNFKNCMQKTGLKESDYPTLSYGVSVTYYKFPMFEALQLADSFLQLAKSYSAPKDFFPLKNNIVFSLRKHSGQTRSVLIHKGNKDSYDSFLTFMNRYTSLDEKMLLSSVMNSLRDKECMLTVALTNDMLANFFNNNFNEPVHKQYAQMFDDLKIFLTNTYKEYSSNECSVLQKLEYSMPDSMKYDKDKSKSVSFSEKAAKAAIETVFNTLQFIHLLNLKDNV